MLELRSLTKRLGTFQIRELSLEIRQGEYFILLGPSGVGKTVLIETIAGLIRPDAGTILWRGRDITLSPPEKRRFAVVYQDCALFPHMSVSKNVLYGLRSRAEADRRLASIAQSTGIGGLLDRSPESLSGGERQRVALARSLMTDPELLLLDEPLSSLDVGTRRQFRAELKRIHRQAGVTLLHVTHDLEEAMSLGERVGVMLDGRLHQCATPEELFRRPSSRVVAEFLGMRNVISVTHAGDGLCRSGDIEIHAAEADASTSHVWIRPEEIVLSKRRFSSSARNQFKGRVIDWEHSGTLLAVRVECRGLPLVALITYASFKELDIRPGAELYATFKSSSVHCL